MTSPDHAKKLHALIKRLRKKHAESVPVVPTSPDWEGVEPLLRELIHSMLIWESSAALAHRAMERLRETFVDANELRIALSDEVIQALGDGYPLALERSARLKAVLFDVYRREHAMTLASLATATKREARTYLDSLEGVPEFVRSRVVLLCFGGHAVPADERLRARLLSERAIDPASSPEHPGDWIARHIEQGQALETHALLQAWSDEGPPPRAPRPAKAGAKKPYKAAGRSTPRKQRSD